MYQKYIIPVAFVLVISGVISLTLIEFLFFVVSGHATAEHLVSRYVQLIPWLIAVGFLLLIPNFFLCTSHLRKKADKPGWLTTIHAPQARVAPWPKHTHPTAGKTSWSGLTHDKDILNRNTKITIKDDTKAEQKVLPSQLIIFSLSLVLGVIACAFPLIIKSLVFEIPSADIIALKKFTSDASFLFSAVGFLLCGIALMIAFTPVRRAVFDITTNKWSIQTGRIFGLASKEENKIYPVSEIHGIQIIGYRSKFRYDNSHINLYEVNLVRSSGERIGLIKHRNYKTISSDALTLAEHLDIPIWDRTESYYPENPVTNGRIIQPL